MKKILFKFPHFVLYIWTAVMVALWASSKYSTYLKTTLWPLVVMALLLLLFFMVSLFFTKNPFKTERSTDLGLKGLLLLFPLIYMAMSYDTVLSTDAFDRKSFGTEASVYQGEPSESPNRLVQEGEYFRASLAAIMSPYERFTKTKVITNGMIYTGTQMSEGYVMLFRFVVNCCVADARPIGVLIPKENLSLSVDNKEWVEVRGTLEERQVTGKTVKVLIPDQMKRISTPPDNQQYLFFQ